MVRDTGMEATISTPTTEVAGVNSGSAAADPAAQPRPADQPVQLANEGVGPLMQRDYVAIIEEPLLTPEQAMQNLLENFVSLSPAHLARFNRPSMASGCLQLDEGLEVAIIGNPLTAVRVCAIEERRLTLRTLRGHIEAGRITFGADCDPAGRLVLRIRSRARIHDPFRLVGYLLLGKHVQYRIWAIFLERWAAAAGGRRIGPILEETDCVQESLADLGRREAPTLPTTG